MLEILIDGHVMETWARTGSTYWWTRDGNVGSCFVI